jgi:hypothetical protein
MFIKIYEIKEAVDFINNIRKENKDKWYYGHFYFQDKFFISFKGFGTWLQIFQVDEVNANKLYYKDEIGESKSVSDFNFLLTNEFIRLNAMGI